MPDTEEEKNMDSEENKVMEKTTVNENTDVETADTTSEETVEDAAAGTPDSERTSDSKEPGVAAEETDSTGGKEPNTPEAQESWTEGGYAGEFSREQWILTHIGDENLLEYLKMEYQKEEDRQRSKDMSQKRILSAVQLALSLAAVIAVIFLLRDNPTVMVNILYIIAIIAALWIWKNPKSQ